MVSLALLLLGSTPFERLAGTFQGPITFIDLSMGGKERSFPVEVRIVPSADSVAMTFTYHFEPGRSSVSTFVCKPSKDGRKWTETEDDEILRFDLVGWSEFVARKADWFIVERPTETGRFRRKWRLTETGLTSLKWLKSSDGPWEFNHKMDLKRVK